MIMGDTTATCLPNAQQIRGGTAGQPAWPHCGQSRPLTGFWEIRAQLEVKECVRRRMLTYRLEQQVNAKLDKARRQVTRAAEQQVKAQVTSQQNVLNQGLQTLRAPLVKAKTVAAS